MIDVGLKNSKLSRFNHSKMIPKVWTLFEQVSIWPSAVNKKNCTTFIKVYLEFSGILFAYQIEIKIIHGSLELI